MFATSVVGSVFLRGRTRRRSHVWDAVISGGYQYTRCNRPATANIGGMWRAGVGLFAPVLPVCHGWNVMVPLFAQFRFRTSTVVAAAALCWCPAAAAGDAPK